MAALCIKQKDLLHAGYLAITLLFFRQRTQLMMAPAAPHGTVLARGARLFLWLPAFNLFVMGLTLIYQVCCWQGRSSLLLLIRSTWFTMFCCAVLSLHMSLFAAATRL